MGICDWCTRLNVGFSRCLALARRYVPLLLLHPSILSRPFLLRSAIHFVFHVLPTIEDSHHVVNRIFSNYICFNP